MNQNPVSRLPLHSQQLIGVARWPDPAHNEESSNAQRQYGKDFSDASVTFGRGIARGQIDRVETLWTSCTMWRYSKAVAAKDPNPEAFAAPRDDPRHNLLTPIEGKYAYMHERTMQALLKPHPDISVESDAVPNRATTLMLQTTTRSRGQKLGLTQMHVGINPYAGVARLLADDPDPRMRQSIGKMVHTNPQAIPHLLARAEDVFQATLKPGLSKDQRMGGLAEMHWLLAQAATDERGSAAKAEMAVLLTPAEN